MLLGKKPATLIVSIIVLVAAISPTAEAKSVYVISDTENSNLAAYRIDGVSLVHQTNYLCQTDPAGATGAVGLAIDESEHGQFLFVTFEGENKIELVNAKSMQYVDIVEAPDPYGTLDLAGIVVDKNRRKIYIINRRTNNLYVYSWDAQNRELTLDLPDPYYLELADCFEGYGLAFDEENDRLYVADNTTTVKCYDANDPNWSKLDDFTFTTTDKAVGIAIDVNNQYVYTGSSQFGGSTYYITKYDLAGHTETRVNVGSPVLGIAVDQDTSLVYITTYSGGTNPDKLIIYDSNLVKQPWESGDIGNPAGVAVGTTAQYKPPFPFLVFTKDDNDVNCVSPADPNNDEITYYICYDANGQDVNDVNIIDYLPYEVDFNSASGPNMVYDPNTHTVTWSIGPLSPADSNCVYLTVKVNMAAYPASTITNYCGIESDRYYTFTTEDTNVCCWGGDIIYVDVNADSNGYNNGTSWQNAYTDLQDALDTARNCECNEIWVAKGIYKPTTNSEDSSATFELVAGVGLYGGFAGNETSRSWRNWMGNETTLSGDLNGNGVWEMTDAYYVVTASGVTETAIIDGFTIKNGFYSGIMIIGGSPTISHNRITENGEEGIYCKDMQTPLITNNWIHHNGAFGIFFNSAYGVATVRNNTVVYNTYSGIRRRFGDAPNITNCIIWGNTDDLYECYATYSCIENDDPGEGNIYDDPRFVDDPNDPNNYHLSSDSPCIDAANTSLITDSNETDIDGEPRVMGDCNEIVDMGADEVYFPSCWNFLTQCHADADDDDYVGIPDFYLLRDAWDTNYCDDWNNGAGPYNPCADFTRDGEIGLLDFSILRDYWDSYPPNDCNCGGTWPPPPDCPEGRGEGGSSRVAEDGLLLQELTNWLEELLADDRLRKAVGEDEWEKFIESVVDFIETLRETPIY